MATFKCANTEWEIPEISKDALMTVDPFEFGLRFFALEMNQKVLERGTLRMLLMEAYKTMLDRAHLSTYRQAYLLEGWKHYSCWPRSQYTSGSSTNISRTPSAPSSKRPHAGSEASALTIPGPTDTPLSELTLSHFYEHLCYFNPEMQRKPNFDAILSAYKAYVFKYYGRDTAKHIITAFSRTKLPIPVNLVRDHCKELEEAVDRKRAASRAWSIDEVKPDVSSEKRLRPWHDNTSEARQKRTKTEQCMALTSFDRSHSWVRVIDEERQYRSDRGVKAPDPVSNKLYSPTMPHLPYVGSNSFISHQDRMSLDGYVTRAEVSLRTALTELETLKRAMQRAPGVHMEARE